MSPVFVDTNVLLYTFDDAYPDKRDQARAWVSACWLQRRGRVSTQVLNEFYANARKRFRNLITPGDARAEVRRYQEWSPWQIDHATVETAWAVESRYGLNYWDALMVSAAQHMGCTLLLTEDLQHDQQIDNLRIVNPFQCTPTRCSPAPADQARRDGEPLPLPPELQPSWAAAGPRGDPPLPRRSASTT
jgi:predicted nucleic acid-binding protein